MKINQRCRSPVRSSCWVLAPALAVVVMAGPAWGNTTQAAAELSVKESTGPDHIVFIRPTAGIKALSASERAALQTPLGVLERYGSVFGITSPSRELRAGRTFKDKLGFKHTTFTQVYRGIQVFAGTIRVHHDAEGELVAANGAFQPIPRDFSTVAKVTPKKAEKIALTAAGNKRGKAIESHLFIVDPAWYGGTGKGARLAYYVSVPTAKGGMATAYFVDARTGAILDSWSLSEFAINRQIYDAEGTTALPGTLRRSEGQGAAGIADVDTAYDYSGDIYDLYFRGFGRDSWDNAGSRIKITVRRAPPPQDGYWTGAPDNQIVFANLPNGSLVKDDFMGHELTHGVTQTTAGLIYLRQSGQLNESFSDVFGELLDLYNGGASNAGPLEARPPWPHLSGNPGGDTGNQYRGEGCSTVSMGYPNGKRWLIFEDTPSGGSRDMWQPPCYPYPLVQGVNYPARRTETNYPIITCSSIDFGGVHYGSSVPNHAFAMLVDGATFNGQTIRAIGPIKAAAIWYRALTVYLRPTSDFPEAYNVIQQAGMDLVGTTPIDPRTAAPSSSAITLDDVVQVQKAMFAVEMHIPLICGGPPPPPPPPPPPTWTPTPPPPTPTRTYTRTPTQTRTKTPTRTPTQTPTYTPTPEPPPDPNEPPPDPNQPPPDPNQPPPDPNQPPPDPNQPPPDPNQPPPDPNQPPPDPNQPPPDPNQPPPDPNQPPPDPNQPPPDPNQPITPTATTTPTGPSPTVTPTGPSPTRTRTPLVVETAIALRPGSDFGGAGSPDVPAIGTVALGLTGLGLAASAARRRRRKRR